MNTKTILIVLLPILLRTLLSSSPHSGQSNYHGSKTAYGGDYEAQRHWMELTLHLPLSQWYTYDPSYWGLDYPPLIAYGSLIMGYANRFIVGEDCVALDSSRGYEDGAHKAFMRVCVIFWDVAVYFPLAYLICHRLGRGCHPDDMWRSWLVAMIQPALVLIDNGHYQFNNVCLGLALGSFHFMTLTDAIGWHDVIGSVLFCLALNWKQMALYYAPAVFAYLLGKCVRAADQSTTAVGRLSRVASKVAMLGSAVIGTFVLLWYPFYHHREFKDQTAVDVFRPILERIFPFNRGLFEGKVANLWCVAALKPFSVRDRIPEELQPLSALALTFVMMLPFCIFLFQVGRHGRRRTAYGHIRALLSGATGTSLSFFLASFQVHEKSILLPLAPLSLMVFSGDFGDFGHAILPWFSVVCTWSLWHLLVVDRLQMAYFATMAIYLCYLCLEIYNLDGQGSTRGHSHWVVHRSKQLFTKVILPASVLAMVGLHLLEAMIVPPQSLPDIFPVLWIVVGCACFVIMWAASLMDLWVLSREVDDTKVENKDKFE